MGYALKVSPEKVVGTEDAVVVHHGNVFIPVFQIATRGFYLFATPVKAVDKDMIDYILTTTLMSKTVFLKNGKLPLGKVVAFYGVTPFITTDKLNPTTA